MPSPAQIQEIEALVRRAHQIDKFGLNPQAAALYQEAVEKTDEYYEIPLPDHHDGEPAFDVNVPPGGKGADTAPSAGGFKTRIGVSAFVHPWPDGAPSAAWLASVKVHELLGHGAQIAIGADGMAAWIPRDPNEAELEAYDVQYDWAGRCGLSDEMIRELLSRLRTHFRRLPETLRPRWRQRRWFRATWEAVLNRAPD